MISNIKIEDRVEALRQHLIDVKKGSSEIKKILKAFKRSLEEEVKNKLHVSLSTKAEINCELPKLKKEYNLKKIAFSRINNISAMVTTTADVQFPYIKQVKVTLAFVSSDDVEDFASDTRKEKLAKGKLAAINNFKAGKYTYDVQAPGLFDITSIMEVIFRFRSTFPGMYKNIKLNVNSYSPTYGACFDFFDDQSVVCDDPSADVDFDSLDFFGQGISQSSYQP